MSILFIHVVLKRIEEIAYLAKEEIAYYEMLHSIGEITPEDFYEMESVMLHYENKLCKILGEYQKCIVDSNHTPKL